MLTPLHQFLTTVTLRAVDTLEAAFLSLPEDKRAWSPGGTARSAIDMLAECAIVNDTTELLRTRSLPADTDQAHFQQEKTDLAEDWHLLSARLHRSTANAIAALQAVPVSDLEQIIEMPWGNHMVSEVMAYPYWNMSYHEGQINAIAAQLERA